tara:strand:- start:4165 stop:4479 length:315 start_codon:yes stop_codon:yes gene_type:complete
MTYNTKEKFETKTYFDGDVIRWISNNRVPPKDIVEQFFENGFITAEQKEYADNTRDIELTEFLKEYKKAQANRTPEQIEAERKAVRAAFYSWENPVNIITGEVI